MFEQLKQKETLWASLSIFLGALSIFAVIAIIAMILKIFGVFGQQPYPTKTITVYGEGSASAAPDLAVITFTVQEERKDIGEAQDQSTEKANAVIAKLKSMGIDEKDLKTTYYNISPKYETRKVDPSCTGYVCDMTQIVIGYTVSHTVQVKVRDTAMTGKVLATLGENNVTNFSGPDLTIDEDKDIQSEAKLEAIADARAKAKATAKGLGVSLGRLVSYYEDNGYGMPVPYMESAQAMDVAAGSVRAKVAPSIPVGENEVTARVTLTYKIR